MCRWWKLYKHPSVARWEVVDGLAVLNWHNLFPSHTQPPSPSSSSSPWPSGAASPPWSSSSSSFCPAGGAGRGGRCSEKATRRPRAKRGKTPRRGKTERQTKGEEEGDRERNRRIKTAFSLALRLTLGIRACGAPSPGRGLFLFSTGHFTSNFLSNCSLWIPYLDQSMGSCQ